MSFGNYLSKSYSASGVGVPLESVETLKHLKYNPATNQIESDREIQTTLNSFFLGEQIKLSSGGQNLFVTNLYSQTNFFPAWSGLKDHRIVANRGASGVITPSIRKYADMQTLEPYGAPAASGSVAYNKAAALLGNHSVLGQTFIVMEAVAADDWLEYQVWYGTDETGIQAYEQKFTGQAYTIGDTVDWWFTHPIEGFTGTPIVTCIKLRKGGEDGEAHYLQVRPSASNAANHYSAVRLRVFNDAPIHTPRVGDLKESFQTSDHEGWILLNGRAKVGLTPAQQAAATMLSWGDNIPDHSGRVSVGSGVTYQLGSIGGSNVILRENLPIFGLDYSGSTSESGEHTHNVPTKTVSTTDTTVSISTLYGYSADGVSGSGSTNSSDVVWYNGDGRVNKGNGKTPTSSPHNHSITIPQATTDNPSSNHNHTYSGTTQTMNGGDVQQDYMVPYMAVNKFVYLGY